MSNLASPDPDKLAALYAILACQWQPMETAPTDGTVIMLWARELGFKNEPEHIVFGYYVGGAGTLKYREELSTGWEATTHFKTNCNLVPSHWMPLPPPPRAD